MAYVMPVGCTVTNIFTIPVSGDEVVRIFVSYEQGNRVIVEKDIHDCTFYSEEETVEGETKTIYYVSVGLSQADTLKFKESCPTGSPVKIQLRLKLTSGTVMKSNVITTFADELIKKGEI